MSTPNQPARKVASLDDVSRFVMECNALRFPDTRTPWPDLLPDSGPVKFEPLAADVLAEAKPEGRLIEKRRVNPHD